MSRMKKISPRRKHKWDEIDPLIFSGKISLASLSERFDVPYRQVTNRKYNLRDKLQRLSDKGDEKELRKFMRYLRIRDLSKIKMLSVAA